MAVSADPYIRRARLARVIDGDTVVLLVDLGYYVNTTQYFRLLGVDTPELRSRDAAERAAAQAARQYVIDWFAALPQGEWTVLVRSMKDDSFGRFLGEITDVDTGRVLNEDLITVGHAKAYTP